MKEIDFFNWFEDPELYTSKVDPGHLAAEELARRKSEKSGGLKKVGKEIESILDKGIRIEGKIGYQRGPTTTRIDYFFFGERASELTDSPKARKHPYKFAHERIKEICPSYEVGTKRNKFWIPK